MEKLPTLEKFKKLINLVTCNNSPCKPYFIRETVSPKNITKTPIKFFLLIITMGFTLPSIADSLSARSTGQGFNAITQDFSFSLSNPALLGQYDSKDDLFFSFNLGGMGSDQFDVVDTSEIIAKNLKNLVNDIEQQQTSPADLNAQADAIISDLEHIDKRITRVRNGINFQLIIPTKLLTFGLFTNQYGRIGGLANYDENDQTLLKEAISQGQLNLDDLRSTANGIGYSVAEAGVMLGYQPIKNEYYEMSIGTKVKYQRIDLFYNSLNISEFDDNEFELDNEKYLTDESGINIDLGLYISWGDDRQWRAALVTNNVISQRVKHIEQDLIFKVKAYSTVGFSYHNSWLTLSTEFDLSDREQFESLMASKYAAVGAEFAFTNNVKVRLGLRNDLNDVDGDLYTLGLGLSPWDVLSIDLAAFAGSNDTLGGAIQLGFKI